MALFLFIILLCVAAGLVGVVVHGLIWLLIIAVAIFLANLVLGGYRLRGRATREHVNR